jgi:hypothetical protein
VGPEIGPELREGGGQTARPRRGRTRCGDAGGGHCLESDQTVGPAYR